MTKHYLVNEISPLSAWEMPQVATIKQIDKELFLSHESFAQFPDLGKCRLIGISGCNSQYDDSTLIRVRPLSGARQVDVMVSRNALFSVRKLH
ncbi:MULTISPECIES: hypothetical protein [Vibrio harveyi group]|uniref:hypothetical protein n=1 Tax=Vibrio harveyi group TaxID=717610 RepID=UPI0011105E65|nr:hypothetical protein [Vibrio parahaemolyticus]MDG2761605.1 hypothetical protein [Vibrio parahaemolyticus]TMX40856.1 hypothetical protein DA098_03225 [Vibrio parahaemolyticus]TMX79839.1 hypothetical protein DA094_04975 [Vibrio parahaemolyticus]